MSSSVHSTLYDAIEQKKTPTRRNDAYRPMQQRTRGRLLMTATFVSSSWLVQSPRRPRQYGGIRETSGAFFWKYISPTADPTGPPFASLSASPSKAATASITTAAQVKLPRHPLLCKPE